MKKVKFSLPLLSFALAVVSVFAFSTKPPVSPDYYVNAAGTCTQISSLSCNNSGSVTCTYDDGDGIWRNVYESRSGTTCITVLKHSLNGGHLN